MCHAVVALRSFNALIKSVGFYDHHKIECKQKMTAKKREGEEREREDEKDREREREREREKQQLD